MTPLEIVKITDCLPHFIWSGIEVRLVEKDERTGQWKCETTSPLSKPYTIYLYEDQVCALETGVNES